MDISKEKKIQFLLQEIIYRRNFVVIVFCFITVSIILVGLNWPKKFTSSTTIFVEEQNILGPLMEGAAVQTVVVDRAAIAREMIYGHKIIYQLLEKEGLIEENPDPAVQERIMNSIKGQTKISNARRNLIKIEFQDSDPDRSYRITNTLANLFIEESLRSKSQESIDAFTFIEMQANEYKEKLQAAEQALKVFRTENVGAQPNMAGQIGTRSAELQRAKSQLEQDLREKKIRKSSLVRQLSGEAQASSAFSRSEQNKTRIADLQAQLDVLRLKYHETYPDIEQIKLQINDLRTTIKRSESQDSNSLSGATDNIEHFDERVLQNPVYQQLQRDLYNTNTEIETLTARLEQTISQISEQHLKAIRVEEFQTRLHELTRDYDVNHESYTDLMRRREQARVSMNLDIERKGLTLRVDEPAYFPHSPNGLRFLHFLLVGPLVGLILPISILFLWRQIDPKFRSEAQLYNKLGIPMLGKTPHLFTPTETRRETVQFIIFTLMFIGTLAFVIIIGVLRMKGQV